MRNPPQKLTTGMTIPQAWQRINELIEYVPEQDIVVDNRRLARRETLHGVTIEDISGNPGWRLRHGYLGDFRVDVEERPDNPSIADVYIFSPTYTITEYAGRADIDGFLKICPAGKLTISHEDGDIFKEEKLGEITHKITYICIKAHRGEFAGYVARPRPPMWKYVGELAARIEGENIKIVHGAIPSLSIAGRARVDGIYKTVAAGALPLASVPAGGAFLCAEFRRGEFYRYTFRKTPAMWAYCGYFAARIEGGGIAILDGAAPTSGVAGYLIVDGKEKSLPSISFAPRSGRIGIRVSPDGSAKIEWE